MQKTSPPVVHGFAVDSLPSRNLRDTFAANRYHTFCVDLDAVPEEDWYCHRLWLGVVLCWLATLLGVFGN